ncbi:hypothetical protein NN561_010776 [Cricetulus griseus]
MLMPSLLPPRPPAPRGPAPLSTRLSLRVFVPRTSGARLLLRTRSAANPVAGGHSSPPGAQRGDAGRRSRARAVQVWPERGSAVWRLGEEGAPGGLRNEQRGLCAGRARLQGLREAARGPRHAVCRRRVDLSTLRRLYFSGCGVSGLLSHSS